jgi:hypothetical protein
MIVREWGVIACKGGGFRDLNPPFFVWRVGRLASLHGAGIWMRFFEPWSPSARDRGHPARKELELFSYCYRGVRCSPTLAAKTRTRRGWGTRISLHLERCSSQPATTHGARPTAAPHVVSEAAGTTRSGGILERARAAGGCPPLWLALFFSLRQRAPYAGGIIVLPINGCSGLLSPRVI